MQLSEKERGMLGLLPNEPGIYRFFDQEKELLYVGKAKDLRKRVSSYFNKNITDRKTRRLVEKIRSVEYTVVNTEFDAYLLENNLIKKYQPRYNILLKDDKTYPYICVTKERFPQIYSTRTLDRKKGNYFGPYSSVKGMYTVLELVRKLFKIRTCNYNLSEENIAAGKFKVCLEYHIGNCTGPCEGLQDEESYNRDIESAVNILKGDIGRVKNIFIERMTAAADRHDYEDAQKEKEKLQWLDNFQSKSMVVTPAIEDMDVFTIISDDKNAYVNYLKIVNGSINQTQNLRIKKMLDEPDVEILDLAIIDLREKFRSTSPDIITNIESDLVLQGVQMSVPKIGDKRKLIELSLKNVLYSKKEYLKSKIDPAQKNDRLLATVQADLHLQDLPRHIECFDNSNLQGSNPVASMVCFRNGVPSKKDYRKYNIKTVVGPDDFASMKEIVTRRYSRLVAEGESLPDLVIVDGGKGQLSAAVEALKALNLYTKIPIIGIAKRLEEIYYPGDSLPLHIDRRSETLRLIQRMRDEAHRFAINFHRSKRSKGSLKMDSLFGIKGVGEKTANDLLKAFKSVKRIREASVDEISAIIGKSRALIVKEGLKS